MLYRLAGMFSKTHKWRRWSGPREAVTEALELSLKEIEEWNNFPSAVEVRISYSDQLTEISNEARVLAELPKTDLHRVTSLWVDIKADRDLWRHQRDDYMYAKNGWKIKERNGEVLESNTAPTAPPILIPGISVSIRLTNDSFSGMTIEVNGPDRTKVAGLMTRLQEVMNHASIGPSNWPSRFRGFIAVLFGSWIGFAVSGLGYLALVGGDYVPKLVLIIGTATMAVFVPALQWTLPAFELLERGERSRFQRFRIGFLSILSSLIVGLTVNAISARKK